MHSTQIPSLKECRTHGSGMFGCAFYESASQSESFYVSVHWHEEIEIIYMKDGTASLEINMEHFELHSECLIFIASGELHRILCHHPYQESAVVFSPYLLNFLSNDLAEERIIKPLATKKLCLPRILTRKDACFSQILSEYQLLHRQFSLAGANPLKEASQLFVKSSLLRILAYLGQEQLLSYHTQMQNDSIEGLKKVLSYIEEHYEEKIYIQDLALLLNLNEQYFCRFFKKAVGKSPISYLNEFRVRKAIVLLTDTSRSVTEISYECGFHNLGNFIREFKKLTGTTPLQYKKS